MLGLIARRSQQGKPQVGRADGERNGAESCARRPAPLKLARPSALSGPHVTDAFQPRSDFLSAMLERGFLHQCSDLKGLDDKARSGSLAGYIGFDCTAPSLHVGNLVGS